MKFYKQALSMANTKFLSLISLPPPPPSSPVVSRRPPSSSGCQPMDTFLHRMLIVAGDFWEPEHLGDISIVVKHPQCTQDIPHTNALHRCYTEWSTGTSFQTQIHSENKPFLCIIPPSPTNISLREFTSNELSQRLIFEILR